MASYVFFDTRGEVYLAKMYRAVDPADPNTVSRRGGFL